MREFSIRVGYLKDVSLLADLEYRSRRAAFLEMYGSADDAPDQKELENRWQSRLTQKICVPLIGLVSDAPVAYCSIARIAGTLHFEIRGLYVLQEYWGRGVGGRMLDSAVGVVRKLAEQVLASGDLPSGDPAATEFDIRLGVVSENARARDFYARRGFVLTGQREQVTLDSSRILEILEMKRQMALPPSSEKRTGPDKKENT